MTGTKHKNQFLVVGELKDVIERVGEVILILKVNREYEGDGTKYFRFSVSGKAGYEQARKIKPGCDVCAMGKLYPVSNGLLYKAKLLQLTGVAEDEDGPVLFDATLAELPHGWN